MDTVFKKMNFKDHKNIVVINAPQSFETNIAAMEGLTTFARGFKTGGETDFILAFCTKQSEVDAVALEAGKNLKGDGLLWYAYPKGTSKRYTCEFNRDNGWAVVGEQGFEVLRGGIGEEILLGSRSQVEIDRTLGFCQHSSGFDCPHFG